MDVSTAAHFEFLKSDYFDVSLLLLRKERHCGAASLVKAPIISVVVWWWGGRQSWLLNEGQATILNINSALIHLFLRADMTLAGGNVLKQYCLHRCLFSMTCLASVTFGLLCWSGR